MKTNELVHNTSNNQLMIVKKGALLANTTYVKATKKTFEILAKTLMLGMVLTLVNMVV